MSNSQVISFRASGHFLNWIEAQRLDDESPSQAAQRILKALSAGATVEVSTLPSTKLSTQSNESIVSTEMSTITPETVDTQIEIRLDPILQQLAKMEERLGKLRA
ncbi:hypothetical protein [Microcoleus sp. herbarium2]|uniref:hypothetical protein n=1 Tax=Microcoleus sp. herbarium2 TaxID=3055433 RepID=UPI002FD20BB9